MSNTCEIEEKQRKKGLFRPFEANGDYFDVFFQVMIILLWTIQPLYVHNFTGLTQNENASMEQGKSSISFY